MYPPLLQNVCLYNDCTKTNFIWCKL